MVAQNLQKFSKLTDFWKLRATIILPFLQKMDFKCPFLCNSDGYLKSVHLYKILRNSSVKGILSTKKILSKWQSSIIS